MKYAAKLMQETPDAYLVGGYGVVWDGRDLEGQVFTQETDFWPDHTSQTPPVLYHHGGDTGVKKSVLGHVVSKKIDDTGLWIEAQIDKAAEYAGAVMELVNKGVLGWSSGSVTHLAEITRAGRSMPWSPGPGTISLWPIVEFSLTPTPCEPRTLGVADLTDLAKSAPSVKSVLDKVKALPAGSVPMDGDGGDPPEGSYEDLIADLSRLVRMACCDPVEYDSYAYIVATFPDYVIACVCDDGMAFFRVPYTVGPDMEPVLTGAPEPMARAYVPVEMPPADTESTAMVADYVTRAATSLSQRLHGLHDSRVKEGRVLSSANRKRLAAAQEAMAGLLKDFEDLLTATEPKTTDEAGTAKALIEVQAAHLRALALAIEIGVPA